MNQINILPDPMNAGLEFNYSAWTPGTQVLLSIVPWDSTYKDVVNFASVEALDNYLEREWATSTNIGAMTYARMGHPIRLDIPFNKAMKYNYLRVRNNQTGHPSYGPENTAYYFVTEVNYIAPNTTEFVIQLDVWQTFGRFAEFGRGFCERGHVGIAQNNVLQNSGRDFLAVPEGFDLGGEYSNVAVYEKSFGDAYTGNFDIVVWSNTRLHGTWGNKEKPQMHSAEGSTWEGLPNGASAYYFDRPVDFSQFLILLSWAPWISQGIMAIQAIPNGIIDTSKLSEETFTYSGLEGQTDVTGKIKRISDSGSTKLYSEFLMASNFRSVFFNALPDRYSHLFKFGTYPFSFVEMTTHMGAPIVIKPECVDGGDLTVSQLAHIAQPAPRVVFYPKNYNAVTRKGTRVKVSIIAGDSRQMDGKRDAGESLDMTTGFFNFPTFSLLNNSYISFMASNANSIAYQHSNAEYGMNKSLSGNALSSEQQTKGIELNSAMNTLGNTASIQKAGIGVMSSLGGGAASGGALGASAALMGSVANVAGTAVDVNANTRRTSMTNANAAYMRDSNRSYADSVARGDYAQTIAGINARVQDARLVQPTTSGQVGGEAFLFATYGWALTAKFRMISAGAVAAIGDYWLRYGYRINRWISVPHSLMVMERFTYWKFSELSVTSTRIPELYRQTIRGIFEKGVTVWKNPDEIGNSVLHNNAPVYATYIEMGN